MMNYFVCAIAAISGTRTEAFSTTLHRQNNRPYPPFHADRDDETKTKPQNFSSSKRATPRTIAFSRHESIEPYVGPISSLSDMEGGIAIGELALDVLVGPSLVADGRGLFLCIYDDAADGISDGASGGVEEIIVPRGTPLCGYARGYFSDKEEGDKSVGFLFPEDSADVSAVFYNRELTTLGDALRSVHGERLRGAGGGGNATGALLFGHLVDVEGGGGGRIKLRCDDGFRSRIFVPEVGEGDEFTAASLGVFANDLAYDPGSDRGQYLKNSETNNVLELVWRLAEDEKSGMLVPTWPVVIARKDLRLLNTVPMEVGLQYGYNYWDAAEKV